MVMSLTRRIVGKIRAHRKGDAIFSRAAINYAASYFRADLPTIVIYSVIGAAQSLLVFPTFHLIRQAFDQAIPNSDTELLIWIGVEILVLRLVTSAVAIVMRVYCTRTVKRAIRAMRQDLMAKLLSLSRDFYVRSDTELLHTQIIQDTERADTSCNALLANILPSIPAALALAVALLWLNWWLTLLAAAVAPLVLVTLRLTTPYVQRNLREFHRSVEVFSAGVHFVIRQMDLIRIRANESQELVRQTAVVERLYSAGVKMFTGYAIQGQIQGNVTGLAGLVLLVFGGIAIADKSMTMGDFMVFYLAAGQLSSFVDRISGAIPEMLNGNAALSTLLKIYHSGPTEPYAGAQPVASGATLRMKDVGYSIGARKILRDVSLEIGPGANVAIMGPNGAGKSTILNMLIGFSRPDSGEITADGVPYPDIDIRSLRRSVGMVLQHPTFFQGTIAENICYGMSGHGEGFVGEKMLESAMIQAARLANADNFIRALPDGYDTVIGDEGTRLSGGELQRIAIARALVGRPALLILDEPTNHLDAETVGLLMQSLTQNPDRPAVLVVSHDQSVVRYAASVYRLADGHLTKIVSPVSP